LEKSREEQVLPGGGCYPNRKGEDIRKGYSRVTMVEYYILMYENGKMRPAETIPGMGERDKRD
jgi:hypothetical protein